MTDNDFNQRADNAGRSLKQTLSAELTKKFGKEVVIPESQVEAGPDGRPPPAPPPANSYIGMARANAQEQPQELPQEAPPVQEAPVQTTQPQESEPEISENAQNRIRQLVADLRDKDRALQTLQAEHSSTASTVEEMKARHQALEQSYKNMLEQNLESMDPETRMAVMQDARMNEAIVASEQRILSTLNPQLEIIRQKDAQDEMARVAAKYPGFNYDQHPQEIEYYRSRNPASSVEMAFKAVATPEALGIGARPAIPVPPVLQPGNGTSVPRSVPSQTQRSDPEAELVEESRRAAALARSNNHADQKESLKMFDQNIGKRIFGQR